MKERTNMSCKTFVKMWTMPGPSCGYRRGMKSVWIGVAGAAMLVGCVEREWTISSEPAGAIVEVSGVEKGRTPLTISFTYYGDYEVIFRKAGGLRDAQNECRSQAANLSAGRHRLLRRNLSV